ncbi:hypothetical protein B0T13DRAFT_142983 [Neurospora crassa]|nr:hypothetical protein B0T13DRAFT_142983 [Neurospora crassa]
MKAIPRAVPPLSVTATALTDILSPTLTGPTHYFPPSVLELNRPPSPHLHPPNIQLLLPIHPLPSLTYDPSPSSLARDSKHVAPPSTKSQQIQLSIARFRGTHSPCPTAADSFCCFHSLPHSRGPIPSRDIAICAIHHGYTCGTQARKSTEFHGLA